MKLQMLFFEMKTCNGKFTAAYNKKTTKIGLYINKLQEQAR